MIKGKRGEMKDRSFKIEDRSQITEKTPAFHAGHPTNSHMRVKSYGLKDKISMQATKPWSKRGQPDA